jgi:hypothetical protein
MNRRITSCRIDRAEIGNASASVYGVCDPANRSVASSSGSMRAEESR